MHTKGVQCQKTNIDQALSTVLYQQTMVASTVLALLLRLHPRAEPKLRPARRTTTLYSGLCHQKRATIETYNNIARYKIPSDGTPISPAQPSFETPGQTKLSGDRGRKPMKFVV